jgi:hypothetical protein
MSREEAQCEIVKTTALRGVPRRVIDGREDASSIASGSVRSVGCQGVLLMDRRCNTERSQTIREPGVGERRRSVYTTGR